MGLAPLIRELDIWHLRWALRDMHPGDARVPGIVIRLRRRLDERAAAPPSILRRAIQWL